MDKDFNPFKEEITKFNKQQEDVQSLQAKIETLLHENLDLKKKYEDLKNYKENVTKFSNQEPQPEPKQESFRPLKIQIPTFGPAAIPRKFAKKDPNLDLYLEIITIIDTLDRSLSIPETEETKSLIVGVKMIRDQLSNLLKSRKVEVYAQQGDAFDPKLHEALATCDHESIQSGHIASIQESGYKLNSDIIRLAKVIVVN